MKTDKPKPLKPRQSRILELFQIPFRIISNKINPKIALKQPDFETKYLSSFAMSDVIPGISLFTAIKNRHVNFEEVLQSWLMHKQISEIIIVDWDSEKSLAPLIQKYQDGRIILAEVKNQPKWVLSIAFNLSARLTTRNRLLKMDADVKIMPSFFKCHDLKPGNFYCGNWQNRRNDNEKHLNGTVYLYRDDFITVNGYNEFIKTYGWDDTDLYKRLQELGLKRNDFEYDTLFHIPHNNRIIHQDKPDFLKNIPDKECAAFTNCVNRHLGTKYGIWTKNHSILPFFITKKGNHFYECKQATNDQNHITENNLRQCEIIAIIDRLLLLDGKLSSALLKKTGMEELILLFNLYFEKKTNPDSKEQYEIMSKSFYEVIDD
jgi:hypothetical protein